MPNNRHCLLKKRRPKLAADEVQADILLKFIHSFVAIILFNNGYKRKIDEMRSKKKVN